MVTDDESGVADPCVVRAWVHGWALARETSMPVPHSDGYRIVVGWPRQKMRYVFPEITPSLLNLAETINDPWVFLKACVPREKMRSALPSRWVVQPLGYMMTCLGNMQEHQLLVPSGYSLEIEDDRTVPIARVRTRDGILVAAGRLATVGEFAIYDRITTDDQHQRRGLASSIMVGLGALARQRDANRGVVVATRDGRSLYASLGWAMHSPYTTAVIPEAPCVI